MKKILGLDLGVASIGWALINEDDKPEIIGMGSRIIPIDPENKDDFERGNPNGISKNAARTLKRSIRRGNYRYKLRREFLVDELNRLGMLPDKAFYSEKGITGKNISIGLFGLHDEALKKKIELNQLGRILLHLNQKRGYKSTRKEEAEEAEKKDSKRKETEYLSKINSRTDYIRKHNLTVGQFLFQGLKGQLQDWNEDGNNPFKTKEKIFPRDEYINEFNRIWDFQEPFYPDILTEKNKQNIYETIYYQRPLKSQKGLVSACEFEGKFYKNKEGKETFSGPKVAPRSSPLFQLCKIWESINNISLKKRSGLTRKYEPYILTAEKKLEIFEHLNKNEKLSQVELLKMLGLKKDETYTDALTAKKGLQGNLTKAILLRKFPETFHALLQFDLQTETYEVIDKNTGEVINRKRIRADFEKQPLYQLWHCIYSIPDKKELIKTLEDKFLIPKDYAEKLSKIDFTKGAFGNKSAKAMRNIIPYLHEGLTYDKACLMAGYNHSDSLTKEANQERRLKDELTLLPKNSLRQPVVEKILNQTINLVNAIIKQYGKPDEIRIELARELKQGREDRNDTYNRINEAEANHERILKLLEEHPEFKKKKVSRRDIDRYKLWEEFDGVSPYEPNKQISISELYNGEYDIEHIIPKSVMFDDSFSNKTICPRKFNSGENAKNKLLGFDYMKTRSENDFENYLGCIQTNKKISRTKRDKLLKSITDLDADFIERQLRETQYIARKSREILQEVCRDVFVTSGKITAHLRKIWGWEDVLMNLQLPKYRELGLTVTEEYESNGQKRAKEKITAWGKRDDHRHHAVDALAVACTKQGFIQRINSLNAAQTREEMYNETKNIDYKEKLSLLDKYLLSKRPFATAQVQEPASEILISFKAGKKVATIGKKKIKKGGKKVVVQNNIIIPRGPLSQEFVYGRIKTIERNIPLKKVFERSDSIVKPLIKTLVQQRIKANEGNILLAFKSTKKKPIIYNDNELTYASLFKEEHVLKYPVQSIVEKDLEFIVDNKVRGAIEKRLAQYNNKPNEAFKDLANNPIWLNEEKRIPIKTVRLFTNTDAVVPIRVEDKPNNLIYQKYVKPANNHHIAIYKDETGKRKEHSVTFWDAVERKKYGLPVVIKNPKEVWDKIGTDETYPETLLNKLPDVNSIFESSLQQNEMFVFNMSKEVVEECLLSKDFISISDNLFRVQKLATNNYCFRHHLETKVDNKINEQKNEMLFKQMKRLIILQSIDSYSQANPIKIKLDVLGQIVKIGE